jgi:hypothetical protein
MSRFGEGELFWAIFCPQTKRKISAINTKYRAGRGLLHACIPNIESQRKKNHRIRNTGGQTCEFVRERHHFPTIEAPTKRSTWLIGFANAAVYLRRRAIQSPADGRYILHKQRCLLGGVTHRVDLVHQLDLHVNAANLSWKIPNQFTGIRRVLIDVDR